MIRRAISTRTLTLAATASIGMGALIMPGVNVGDQSIVVMGSLVDTDVPAGSIVVGSPARVVRSRIRTGQYGVLLDAGVDASAQEAKSDP